MPGNETSFAIYGVTLKTAEDFSYLLPQVVEPGDISFSFSHPQPRESEADEVLHRSRRVDAAGRARQAIWRRAGSVYIGLAGMAIFELVDNQIICYPEANARHEAIHHRLLSTVLAVWLELHGLPVLHASAVIVKDHAVGFLALQSSGKSSLASVFLRSGYFLLTDDLLVVKSLEGQFWAQSGYPALRLWPEEAQQFFGDAERFPTVPLAGDKRRIPVAAVNGYFYGRASPISILYILDRRSAKTQTDVQIFPLPLREAMIALNHLSFAPRLVRALGLEPQRLPLLAALIEKTPVRRLVYPSGYEHLPAVRAAVIDDINESTI